MWPQNPEGRQLLLEGVALIGALLLALDRRIEGGARERSVVALYRARGGAQVRLVYYSSCTCLATGHCLLWHCREP